MRRIRSPLTYPGGKYQLSKWILSYIPQDTDKVVSPFFGGGTVELNLAYNFGATVHAYDIYSPLINFWKHYLENPSLLMWRAGQILEYHHSRVHATPHNSLIASLINIKSIQNLDELAAYYYIWNKLSRSGKTIEGWKPSISEFDIDVDGRWVRQHNNGWWTYLISEQLTEFYDKNCEFLNINVGCQSWEQSLIDHDDCFAYLDPPYLVEQRLYGLDRTHRFTEKDHRRLAKVLRKRKQWLQSNNNHPLIRELYEGYKIIETEKYNSMGIGRNRYTEVLIISHDIAEKLENGVANSQLTLF